MIGESINEILIKWDKYGHDVLIKTSAERYHISSFGYVIDNLIDEQGYESVDYGVTGLIIVSAATDFMYCILELSDMSFLYCGYGMEFQEFGRWSADRFDDVKDWMEKDMKKI